MLNKYWNSPSLALTVRPSRIRRCFVVGLALALAAASYLVFSSGYSHLALGMVLLAAPCLWLLHREPLSGASLGWRQGQWLVFQRGELRALELRRGHVCLSWLIQLSFTAPASGETYALVLFPDSAEERALRSLRRRLTLER